MSVLLLESFDDGLFPSKWTAAAANTSTVGPRTGTHKVGLGDVNTSLYMYRELGVGAHATIIVGAGVNFSTLVAGDNQGKILSFKADAGATQHIGVKLNDTGAFSVYLGGDAGQTLGTLLGTTAPNLVIAGTWYHFEIKVYLHDTSGTVEIRLNNTVVFTFTGDTKNGGTESIISRVIVGTSGFGNGDISLSVDDVYILNGAGTSNNNFIGDSKIHNLLPDANGNYSQLLGSDANSVDNYLLVDETPPNTSDYVGSGTAGQKDSYNFPSVPAAVTLIRAVGQRSYAASSDAGARASRNFVRIGATDYVGADYNLGTTYLLYETLFDVSPATTVAFTPAELNGAEWGFEVRT